MIQSLGLTRPLLLLLLGLRASTTHATQDSSTGRGVGKDSRQLQLRNVVVCHFYIFFIYLTSLAYVSLLILQVWKSLFSFLIIWGKIVEEK